MPVKESLPGGGKKYELVPDQQVIVDGTTLYRIRALKDFGNVKAGALGGFVASERNLSQHGDCWVADDALVYDEAVVSDGAQVRARRVSTATRGSATRGRFSATGKSSRTGGFSKKDWSSTTQRCSATGRCATMDWLTATRRYSTMCGLWITGRSAGTRASVAEQWSMATRKLAALCRTCRSGDRRVVAALAFLLGAAHAAEGSPALTEFSALMG